MVTRLGDESVDEAGPPARPGRRAGRARVSLGQRGKHRQGLGRANDPGDVRRRRRILDVPAGRGGRQQQVPPDEPRHRVGVHRLEPPPKGDVPRQRRADPAVVTGPTLADVVQESGHDEQVRSRHGPQVRDDPHAGLDAVPVDREPVHRRGGPPQPDHPPLGQPLVDDSGEVQLVPDRHEAGPGGEEVDQVAAHRRGPR